MKNNRVLFSQFIILCALALATVGCKKTETNNGSQDGTPVVATIDNSSIAIISSRTATIYASVTSEGRTPITAKGICWSTHENPTIADNKTVNRLANGAATGSTNQGAGISDFIANITRLTPNTLYYARVYATNSFGTSYSNQISFRTDATDTSVTDIDGNEYRIVTIGTQVWMAENLKTTKYNDGTPIPYVPDSTQWVSLTTPGYCYFESNTAYRDLYGNFYNWYAARSEKLAPAGWHVPSDSEWTVLANYLGGVDVAGGKMKTNNTTLWNSPNLAATNSSGFSAIPAGERSNHGMFIAIKIGDGWWSADETDATTAKGRSVLSFLEKMVSGSVPKIDGHSIRCVRDN